MNKVIFTSRIEMLFIRIRFSTIQGHAAITPIDGMEEDQYKLSSIKEIITPKSDIVPTPIQYELTTLLQREGYKWDKQHSIAAAGVVLKRQSDGDFWFFGMEGEIMHNPDGVTIKL